MHSRTNSLSHDGLSAVEIACTIKLVSEPKVTEAPATTSVKKAKQERGAIAEWTVTVLLLAFRHDDAGAGVRHPHGIDGRHAAGGRSSAGRQAGVCAARPGQQVSAALTDVKRGDIIVFRYPVDIRQTFVKRVIGVPGDHIRIENKQVIRNGVRLNEPYKYHKTEYNDSYRDNFPSQPYLQLSEGAVEMLEKNVVNGEVVVPPNSYFAMGDNRDNSLDSRYWGFVPRGNIIGKPLIIYWSYETTTDRLASPTISIDHAVDLVQNFFSKTRWRRTFMLIHGYPSKS